MKRKYIKYIVVFVVILIIIRSCIGFITKISGTNRSFAESYIIIDKDYNVITEEEITDILYEEKYSYFRISIYSSEYRLITTNEKVKSIINLKLIQMFSSSLVFYFKDIDNGFMFS